MIKVVARKFIREEKVKEAIKLYEELVEATRKEKGCISYELYQEDKEATYLAVIEEWESKEDLDKHLKSAHALKLVPMINELTNMPTEIFIYNKVI